MSILEHTYTNILHRLSILSFALLGITTTLTAQLTPIGTYRDGIFAADPGSAEIVAHDPGTQRLFTSNGARNRIDILNISNPANPTLVDSILISPYGASLNHVAIRNGIVAVAVQANPKTNNGVVVFFNTSGTFLKQVTVGALPDMVTFTPDGNYVLSANEGEPNSYNQGGSIDPNGTVSIINISGGVATATVTTLDFTAYNGPGALPAGIRVFGPNATPSQDLEPEYIAVSPNSQTAWVTLQENNAIAVIDIASATITSLFGLGYKNHNLPGNALDPTDRDILPGNVPAIRIRNWPVFGMYQPDGIAAYNVGGQTYIVMANEGDARDYTGFLEEARVSTLTLDPVVFPTATTLQRDSLLGRLTVTNVNGKFDSDADTQYEQIYVFGARSFSIRRADGTLVFDSGDQFEQTIAQISPGVFNSTHDNNSSFDTRSDNKGPEPEGIVIAQLGNFTYAFIGLERVGGIMIYDITNPLSPMLMGYVNNRNFAATTNSLAAGDLGPEGIIFISAANSPIGVPLIVTASEISGTTTIFRINAGPDGRLPVELAEFDAAWLDGAVHLNWRTASEVENAGFEVQRAVKQDDPDFRTIASHLSHPSLRGLGTSSVGANYSFVDDARLAPGGQYLYRLVDVTTDGTRTPHTARQVMIGADDAVRSLLRFRLMPITPNPVSDELTLSFTVADETPVSIEVYDNAGRLLGIPIEARPYHPGAHEESISTALLVPGAYIVRVAAGTEARTARFVVVR